MTCLLCVVEKLFTIKAFISCPDRQPGWYPEVTHSPKSNPYSTTSLFFCRSVLTSTVNNGNSVVQPGWADHRPGKPGKATWELISPATPSTEQARAIIATVHNFAIATDATFFSWGIFRRGWTNSKLKAIFFVFCSSPKPSQNISFGRFRCNRSSRRTTRPFFSKNSGFKCLLRTIKEGFPYIPPVQSENNCRTPPCYSAEEIIAWH